MSFSFHKTKMQVTAGLLAVSQLAVATPPAIGKALDLNFTSDPLGITRLDKDDKIDQLLTFHPGIWNRSRLSDAIKEKDSKKLAEFSAQSAVDLYNAYTADLFKEKFPFSYEQAPEELARVTVQVCEEEVGKLNKDQELFNRKERFTLSRDDRRTIFEHALQGIGQDRNEKFFSMVKSALSSQGDLSKRITKMTAEDSKLNLKDSIAILSYEVTSEVFGSVNFPNEPMLGLSQQRKRMLIESEIIKRLCKACEKVDLGISRNDLQGYFTQAVCEMSQYGDIKKKISGSIIEKSRNLSGEINAILASDAAVTPSIAVLETARKFTMRVYDEVFEPIDSKFFEKNSHSDDKYSMGISARQFLEEQICSAAALRMTQHLAGIKKLDQASKLWHPLPEKELTLEDIYSYLVK